MYTMTSKRWAELIKGENCPFCIPREDENQYHIKVQDFKVSTLYLNKNQTYPGYCLLIFNPRHVNKATDLTPQEWSDFTHDVYLAQQKLEKVFVPTHINIAALGNQISHLHWHIIPRYSDDPRWGAPVWMNTQEEKTQTLLTEKEYKEVVEEIKKA